MRVAPDATIDPSAEVRGCSSIGVGCHIGAGALIDDSILWPGAQIASQSQLKGCIVRTHRSAEGTLTDAVI
jgi:NDP-sugar pyrophosphorylase family protein